MFKVLTTEKFIEKARTIHGDKYDYSKVDYKGTKIHIKIICPIHGEFEQIPNNHLSGNGCKKCFSNRQYINHISDKEEFINKALLKHINKYTYQNVIYKNNNEKVIITCPVHGNFQQTPKGHLSGYGCIKCLYDNKVVKPPLLLEDFIDRANKVHNNKYNYTKTNYVNAKTKLIITCKKHGDFKQKPFNHLNGKGCPVCKASKGEIAIKSILDKNNINNQTEYKIPEIVSNYEYDFYLPDYRILIEFHGIQHYKYIPFLHNYKEDNFDKQKERDLFKKDHAYRFKYRFLELNYKQLKELSLDQFESFILNRIHGRKINE